MERYIEASRQFFAILDDFSPSVEGLSIDEAFVDATGAGRLLGDGPTIARSIKQRVASELALVASVGVAPSKFVAKIASDIDKPDGLCVVEPDRVLAFLHPLPVSRLWGAGKVTQDKLLSLGLRTIGDVARYPENVLRARLGASLGMHLASLARGEDARPVEARGDPVSIGHEETFDSDLDRREDVAIVLIDQADRVAARLRHGELRARVIQLKIRYGDFHTITRRRTLPDATSDGKVIADAALALLAEVEISDHLGKHRKVRLAGVSATQLEPRDAPRQLTLGEGTRVRGERLGDTLDAIHARFGKKAVHRAVLGEPGSGKKAPGKPGKPD